MVAPPQATVARIRRPEVCCFRRVTNQGMGFPSAWAIFVQDWCRLRLRGFALVDDQENEGDGQQAVGHGAMFALGDNKAIMGQRNGDGSIRLYFALRTSEDPSRSQGDATVEVLPRQRLTRPAWELSSAPATIRSAPKRSIRGGRSSYRPATRSSPKPARRQWDWPSRGCPPGRRSTTRPMGGNRMGHPRGLRRRGRAPGGARRAGDR
jgi:hypothetical protein